MKTKIFRIHKNVALLFFGAVLVAQSLSFTLTPAPASAASAATPASGMSIVGQTQSWWYYQAVKICVAAGSSNWSWARTNIEIGNWFETTGSLGPNVSGPFMREIINDIGGNEGASCRGNNSQVIQSALRFWHIEALDLICGDNPDQSEDILSRAGHGDCHLGTNDFDEAGIKDNLNEGPAWDRRVTLIMERIDRAIYDDIAVLSSLNDEMRYAYYLGSFKNGCAYGAKSSDNPVSGTNAYKIAEYIEPAGPMKTHYYSGNKSPSDSIRVWPGGSTMTCKQLADALAPGSNLPNKYAAEVATNPAARGGLSDITNPTPGVATGDDCPLDPGESMRWLGCSIFFAFKNGANKIGDALDQYLFISPDSFGDTAQQSATVFRNIAMVLIVVAGLIMVISQALGFEFLDAYTIRKLMPRLGIALIGIALSWPLLKFAVILTNDLGGLVYDVFMKIPGAAGVTGSGADASTGFGTVLVDVLVGSTAIIALGILASLSFIGTILLALIVGFLVLAVRQLVIFMAIILAPLAIAAYVIPGGQKIWGFWKNTLLTTLFMYPLIMGFIGGGAAMSYLIAGDEGLSSNTSSILAILVYFAPYFMLPFAFKMAGGLMGTIFSIANDKNRGMFDRLKKGRQAAFDARMEHRGNRVKRAVTERQASAQRGLKSYASRSGRVGGFLARRGASVLDGYQGNLEARMSAYQASGSKEINDQIATGMDDEPRGLTVNKKLARQSRMEAARRADGYHYGKDGQGNELYRVGENGTRQYKTLGGAWVSEASVDRAHARWGSDTHAQQTALSYEMRKANSEEEVDGISSRYAALATGAGGWNMTPTQAKGAWIGSSFENQNQHIEFKKTNWETGELGSEGYQDLTDEVYEKRGSYPLSQMHSRTIERLKQAYRDAERVADSPSHQIMDKKTGRPRAASLEEIARANDSKMKLQAIAETFMHEMGGMTRGEDGEPVGEEATDASGRRTVSGQGSAHTNERVWELAQMTGVKAAAPTATYAGPDVHTQVPHTNPAADTVTPPNQQQQH